MILVHHDSGFMVCSSVSKINAQESTKTWYAATQLLCRCHAFLGLKCTCSVLGTARLQHRFISISFTPAGEKVLSLASAPVPSHAGSATVRSIKVNWVWAIARHSLAQHDNYWHTLVIFMLPLLIVLSRAGTLLACTFSSGSINVV